MPRPATAIHWIEDRIMADTGASFEVARHCALAVWEDLSANGYSIVAGPPEGYMFRLVEKP